MIRHYFSGESQWPRATMCEYVCLDAAKIMSWAQKHYSIISKYHSSRNNNNFESVGSFYALYRVIELMS